MTFRDTTIPATDGLPLAASVFERTNRHWVIINSATGVKRAYYYKFAGYLAGLGWSVVIYDYRGIGDSRPESLKGFEGRMRDWGQKDFNGVLAWVERQQPQRLAVVGHSVGGQILAFAQRPGRIERFLAVAAQSGYWRHWYIPRKYFLAFLWYLLMPLLTGLLGYFPGRRFGMGEDLPPRVAHEWARWCRHPDYFLGQRAKLDFPGLEYLGPLLAYSFSDDPFCPRRAADAYLSWFAQAPSQHRHLHPADLQVSELGHFSFFRSRFRETVWGEIAQWLEGEPESHAEAQSRGEGRGSR